MGILDIILIGVGLSMDAVAVSVSNGIADHKMKWGKVLLISGAFGLFQGLMPFLGCLLGSLFARFIEIIAPYLAFVLLGFIGGKMLFDGLKGDEDSEVSSLGFLALLIQGIATSIDALSVGCTISEYGWQMAFVCALIIAFVTFFICMAGLFLGKKFGTKLSGKATILGGIILIIIGIEIFIKGIFF